MIPPRSILDKRPVLEGDLPVIAPWPGAIPVSGEPVIAMPPRSAKTSYYGAPELIGGNGIRTTRMGSKQMLTGRD